MSMIDASAQVTAPVATMFQIFTDVEHGTEHVSRIQQVRGGLQGTMPLR